MRCQMLSDALRSCQVILGQLNCSGLLIFPALFVLTLIHLFSAI